MSVKRMAVPFPTERLMTLRKVPFLPGAGVGTATFKFESNTNDAPKEFNVTFSLESTKLNYVVHSVSKKINSTQ